MNKRLQGFLHWVAREKLWVHCNFVGRALFADKALMEKVAHATNSTLQRDEAWRKLSVEQTGVEMVVGQLKFGGCDDGGFYGLHVCIIRYNLFAYLSIQYNRQRRRA